MDASLANFLGREFKVATYFVCPLVDDVVEKRDGYLPVVVEL